MRFAFWIYNHFGFSDGANFGALIDERYPFRVIRLPFNVLMATRPSAVFPTTGEGWKLKCTGRGAGVSITATRLFTDFCTFSKAHTPIWLTRSREMPNSSASSLSVISSSASRTRLEDAPLPVVERGERRGEGLAATAELLAGGECRLLVGMLVDQPVLTSCSVTPRRLATSLTWSGRKSPSASTEIGHDRHQLLSKHNYLHLPPLAI